ncbi:carbohydrate kinase family protein [Spirosoma foliorum]|uniref:Carbohydrate kinase n=1 Tax=Spirosoma foliorum TaxID=2710596 RepID=A0A7G5GNF8_9BACT|nr:carbohydrate kinase [Spirosoma foliorum]QMW00400.1 carbohydrate kinase [Spirosoma foliorum]
MTSTTIICFGEILWDILPDSKQPGGAPMNVAVHLRNLGLNAQLISRVGNDELGRELLNFLRKKHLPTAYVQLGATHLTGIAKANVTERNEVIYKILQPVAWDYIQYDATLAPLYQKSILVYGSLAARNQESRNTLHQLLDQAALKVFDVNLRAPHYTPLEVTYLLQKADILKVSQSELAEIAGWYTSPRTERDAMQYLRNRFNLKTICVTRAENGAIMLSNDGFEEHPGFSVNVADTIGSSDSFLAAFLYKILQGETPKKTLEFACATGAYVATQRSATPIISESLIMKKVRRAAVV